MWAKVFGTTFRKNWRAIIETKSKCSHGNERSRAKESRIRQVRLVTGEAEVQVATWPFGPNYLWTRTVKIMSLICITRECTHSGLQLITMTLNSPMRGIPLSLLAQ